MRVIVHYEGGDVVSKSEVSLTWNHYLGDGWTTSATKTDSNGNAKFPQITKRVPLIASAFWSFAGIFLHYYPGLAGDIRARDANNHHIWQRVDFNDRNCCPSEITISLHEDDGEASNRYFIFEN